MFCNNIQQVRSECWMTETTTIEWGEKSERSEYILNCSYIKWDQESESLRGRITVNRNDGGEDSLRGKSIREVNKWSKRKVEEAREREREMTMERQKSCIVDAMFAEAIHRRAAAGGSHSFSHRVRETPADDWMNGQKVEWNQRKQEEFPDRRMDRETDIMIMNPTFSNPNITNRMEAQMNNTSIHLCHILRKIFMQTFVDNLWILHKQKPTDGRLTWISSKKIHRVSSKKLQEGESACKSDTDWPSRDPFEGIL